MSKKPIVVSLPANQTSWRTILYVPASVTGRLKGIGVVQTENDVSHIQIHVDNSELIKTKIGSSHNSAGNDGINLDIPFTDGLKIQVKDGKNPSNNTRFWASCVVDLPDQ